MGLCAGPEQLTQRCTRVQSWRVGNYLLEGSPAPALCGAMGTHPCALPTPWHGARSPPTLSPTGLIPLPVESINSDPGMWHEAKAKRLKPKCVTKGGKGPEVGWKGGPRHSPFPAGIGGVAGGGDAVGWPHPSAPTLA